MKDKLDILVDLIQKGDKKYCDPYEDMLRAVAFNSDAFLFLYESLPEAVRPKLNDKSAYFRELFVNAISKQDERTFNNYFFNEIHELLSIDEIRALHFKLPENEKLKSYLKSKDNPKNIDEIVGVLSQLWSQNAEHYQEMLEQYSPKLEKLAEIKSRKSRAAEYFSYWGSQMIKREGLDSFLSFCEKINLEPFRFCMQTGKNFGLEPHKMAVEDLRKLINYGDKLFNNIPVHSGKPSYQVIEMMSGYAPIIQFLKKVSEQGTAEDTEKFGLIWETQQLHIKHTFNKIRYNTINLDRTCTVDVIKQVANEIFAGNSSDWHKDSNMNKSDFFRIIAWGTYAEVNMKVPLKDGQTETKRIKI
jgi:hypothetical protein